MCKLRAIRLARATARARLGLHTSWGHRISHSIRRLSVRRALLIPATAGLVVLVGCSPVETVPSPTSSAVELRYPDIGPPPAPHEYSDAELAALRQSALDRGWADVLAAHPGSSRPTVGFVGYIDDYSVPEPIVECLRSQGVDATLTADGKSWTITGSPDEASEVGIYVCNSTFPDRPTPGLTDEQIGYLFDYLTTYRVPCLEQAGFQVDKPPTRQAFIESWPAVGWYPSPYSGIPDPTVLADVEAQCPPSPPGL